MSKVILGWGSEANRELLPIAHGSRGFIPEHRLPKHPLNDRYQFDTYEKRSNVGRCSKIRGSFSSRPLLRRHHVIPQEERTRSGLDDSITSPFTFRFASRLVVSTIFFSTIIA